MIRLIFIFFAVLPAFSQAQTTVKVVDQHQNTLPGANILYGSLNNTKETGASTDISGVVKLPADQLKGENEVWIQVSFLGYETLRDTIKTGSNLTLALSPAPFNIDPVVVTGQFTQGSAEKSVHKVKVIDQQHIEALGAVNLRDVLMQETNIRVSYDPVLGSSAGIQGISGENLKILIDGVPMIGRTNGSIDLSQINLSNIERIEVVEGPMSVTYGTNALAGTINLITKKVQDNKWQAQLNAYHESTGQYNLDGNLGWSKGNHRIGLSGGRNYFDGWNPSDDFFYYPGKTLADSSRVKAWNPKEQYFFRAEYNWQGKNWEFRPFIDAFREDISNRGAPRAPYQENAFDDEYRTIRLNQGLYVQGNIGSNWELNITSSHQGFERQKNTYTIDLTTLERALSENPGDQDTSTFDLWMSRGTISSRAIGDWKFQGGYDFNLETAGGERIEGQEQAYGDYAVFTSAEWNPWKELTLKPGLRYAYNTVYDAPLIPSMNLRLQQDNYTVRLSYARGFRAPTLKELYFDFVDINHNIQGNQGLKAETSDNFQMNSTWKKVGSSYVLKINTGVFYNDIENLITLGQVPNSTEFTYINIGDFRTQGAQFGAEWFGRQWEIKTRAVVTGRYNRDRESNGVPDYSYSPEYQGNFTYRWQDHGLRFSVFYKYTGSLPGFSVDEEGTVTETSIEAYQTMDASIGKNFLENRLKVTIGAKNLFDIRNVNTSGTTGDGAHSTSVSSVPIAWGRSVFASVKWNLEL